MAAAATSKWSCRLNADTTGVSLQVEGQTPTTAGSYTIDMDFEVAMSTTATPTEITVEGAPAWGDTVIAEDDTTLQIDKSGDADYFVFASTVNGFLTVEATNAAGETQHSKHRRNALWPKWADCNGLQWWGWQPFQAQGADPRYAAVSSEGDRDDRTLQLEFCLQRDDGPSCFRNQWRPHGHRGLYGY